MTVPTFLGVGVRPDTLHTDSLQTIVQFVTILRHQEDSCVVTTLWIHTRELINCKNITSRVSSIFGCLFVGYFGIVILAAWVLYLLSLVFISDWLSF